MTGLAVWQDDLPALSPAARHFAGVTDPRVGRTRLYPLCEISLMTLGATLVSRLPVLLGRAKRLRVVALAAPLGCKVVKVPPTMVLPSVCAAVL